MWQNSHETATAIPPTNINAERCFPSNLDITGTGVRASTYIQSLLLFITTFVFVFDGFVDSKEQKVLSKTYSALLMTACALLLSAIVQSATSGLSVYHALVVLDLCWMLISNALVINVLPTIDGQYRSKRSRWIFRWWPSRAGQLRAFLLVSAHLCAMGAVGIYVWSNPARLGHSLACTQATITYVFVSPKSAANHRLRIASLFFYSIAAIPLLNVMVFSAFVVFIVNFVNFFIPTPYTYGRLYRIAVTIQAVVNALLIASTELTVRKNRHLGDGATFIWGFGQILVLILTISPVLGVVRAFSQAIPSLTFIKLKVRMDYWIHGRLRESETSWSWVYMQLNDRIHALLPFFQTDNAQPVSLEWEAIRNSLKNSEAYLTIANKQVTNSEENAKHFQSIEYATPVTVEETKQEISRICEYIYNLCDVRFPDVHDAKTYAVVKAYLKSTKDALETANNALEAYSIAHKSLANQ